MRLAIFLKLKSIVILAVIAIHGLNLFIKSSSFTCTVQKNSSVGGVPDVVVFFSSFCFAYVLVIRAVQINA